MKSHVTACVWAQEPQLFPEEEPGREILPKSAADAPQPLQQWRLLGAGKSQCPSPRTGKTPKNYRPLCFCNAPISKQICSTQSAMYQCSPEGMNGMLLMFWHHACLPGVGEPFIHWETRWWQIITTLLVRWCQEVNVKQWDYNSKLI